MELEETSDPISGVDFKDDSTSDGLKASLRYNESIF